MLREFTDKKGVVWQVWDVYPVAAKRRSPSESADEGLTHLPGKDLTEGWLCFQCDNEKRRLAPIPPEWEICDCTELEGLCSKAGYISKPN